MVLEQLDNHMQKNETGLFSYTIYKIKCIKDLNVRSETIRLLKEIIGSKLHDITLSDVFLDPFPQARETEAKINTRYSIKLKTFAQQRKPSTKQKGKLLNGRR